MIINEKQKSKLDDMLKFQKESRKNILDVMQSFAESTNSIDIDSVNETIKFLEDLKASLELCNTNISLSERLLKEIENAQNNLDQDDKEKQNTNNNKEDKTEINKQINNPTNNKQEDNKPKENKSEVQNENKNDETPKDNNKQKANTNKYTENTLIISDMSGKVILPYTIKTLEEKLQNSNNKYSNIDEIIKKEYTLPITLYKNPFIARFRESYKLMRHKEKSSIKEAFDLGLELMTNYNLHPAIISACKNLDELDIYLDYLDNDEPNKFKLFKIEFKYAPTIVKQKH